MRDRAWRYIRPKRLAEVRRRSEKVVLMPTASTTTMTADAILREGWTFLSFTKTVCVSRASSLKRRCRLKQLFTKCCNETWRVHTSPACDAIPKGIAVGSFGGRLSLEAEAVVALAVACVTGGLREGSEDWSPPSGGTRQMGR